MGTATATNASLDTASMDTVTIGAPIADADPLRLRPQDECVPEAPWSYEEAFARNLGLISPQEQQRLRHSHVAIIGMGEVCSAPSYFHFDPYRQIFRRGRVRSGNRHPWQRVKR